jgi:hypothetical protein
MAIDENNEMIVLNSFWPTTMLLWLLQQYRLADLYQRSAKEILSGPVSE